MGARPGIDKLIPYRTAGVTFSHRKTGRSSAFIIEDNGIGISESDLPRIFEKGFTGQNGRMVQSALLTFLLELRKKTQYKISALLFKIRAEQ